MNAQHAAEILAQHQMRGQGLTSTSPDRCACGELTMPLPGDADVTERRGAAFAVHQAQVLSEAGTASDSASRPQGLIELGEDTVRALVEALQAMPPDAKVRLWPRFLSHGETITDVAENAFGEVELWV